jgi:methyl-accepting chemotaxis protein
VIGVSAPVQEYQETADMVTAEAARSMWTLLWVGLFATVLAGGIWYLFSGRLVAGIRTMIDQLTSAAARVAVASGQVNRSSHDLAHGAAKNSAAVDAIRATLEQFGATTRANREQSLRAQQLSSDAREVAENGSREMEAMSAAMRALGKSGDETVKIVKDIDSIAFQTNILALNAAVEAARAGSAGAGFAVVADEVRNLAQRSANSAHETTDKINATASQSRQAAGQAEQLSSAFVSILSRVHDLDAVTADLASASTEQEQGLGNIHSGLRNVESVTHSTANSARDSASASEGLTREADVLNDLAGELAQTFLGGKRDWKARQKKAPPAAPAAAPKPVKTAAKPVTPMASGRRTPRPVPARKRA